MCYCAEKEEEKRSDDLKFETGRLQRRDRAARREITSLKEQLEQEISRSEQSLGSHRQLDSLQPYTTS